MDEDCGSKSSFGAGIGVGAAAFRAINTHTMIEARDWGHIKSSVGGSALGKKFFNGILKKFVGRKGRIEGCVGRFGAYLPNLRNNCVG